MGCILAELFTLRPVFQGEERKGGQDLFQSDQLNKWVLTGYSAVRCKYVDCIRFNVHGANRAHGTEWVLTSGRGVGRGWGGLSP